MELLGLQDCKEYSTTTLEELQVDFYLKDEDNLFVDFQPGDRTSYRIVFTYYRGNKYFISLVKLGSCDMFIMEEKTWHATGYVAECLNIKNKYTALAVSWLINALNQVSVKDGKRKHASILIDEYIELFNNLEKGS